ncbi:helix-turn-helix transcriptional regulator [Natrinema halophilum]|uniref:HTH iclR-type domain-containing protein n=1 Tax=Natrinema halophilum TaxID=1699371 RepID=A0A7D5KBY5_9EURY|nr:hypothetical protein [Natrinema halophilum]QLG48196.1 hypothetical protein HYG82_04705 [Natrinema halophilum]
MNRPVSVGLVVLAILASVVGASGSVVLATTGSAVQSTADTTADGGNPTAVATTPEPNKFVSQDTQNFDTTTFEIVVHENGSATWTFRHEQRFSNDENATAARKNFESFADEFEANETGLYDRFQNQSRLLTETGAQETGREMKATNFRRSARVEEQFTATGVVEMSFLWTNFAKTESGQVHAGDAFQDIYLASDQSIVIEAGGDLSFHSVEPDGKYAGNSLENADSVRWSGEREFVDGRPRAIFDHPDGSDIGTGGSDLSSPNRGDGFIRYVVGGLVVIGAAIAVAVWYRRYGPGSVRSAEKTADRSPGATSASAAGGASSGAAKDTEQNRHAPGESDDRRESTPFSEEELLTDEDRVVKLIQENGGRMKQVNIVDETGWSKSKVSMLLSDMEDDGTISKLRVGRENIISLEGFEPEATKSPFDE